MVVVVDGNGGATMNAAGSRVAGVTVSAGSGGAIVTGCCTVMTGASTIGAAISSTGDVVAGARGSCCNTGIGGAGTTGGGAYSSSFNSCLSSSASNASAPLRFVCAPSGEETHTLSMEPAVPQTMLSPSSAVPQTMLSPSSAVPHTMLSPSSAVPHTMLSPSFVPRTMLSQSDVSQAVPQTMLSPLSVFATPQFVPTRKALDAGFNVPLPRRWLPQTMCLLHIFWTGTVSPGCAF